MVKQGMGAIWLFLNFKTHGFNEVAGSQRQKDLYWCEIVAKRLICGITLRYDIRSGRSFELKRKSFVFSQLLLLLIFLFTIIGKALFTWFIPRALRQLLKRLGVWKNTGRTCTYHQIDKVVTAWISCVRSPGQWESRLKVFVSIGGALTILKRVLLTVDYFTLAIILEIKTWSTFIYDPS